MADKIELSKSGRATCRTCRKPIEKGVLRFGEEFTNQFSSDGGEAYRFHHMACAAGKMGAKVLAAMEAFPDPIPDREALEKAAKEGAAKGKPAYPHVEKAPSGRAKCLECEETLEKGKLRVAIEREVDTGSFMTKGSGYLHAACTEAYLGKTEGSPSLEEFIQLLRKNSRLPAEELDAALSEM